MGIGISSLGRSHPTSSETSLPSGTALRKPGMARLQQAYSPAVYRAIPRPLSACPEPRREAGSVFLLADGGFSRHVNVTL